MLLACRSCRSPLDAPPVPTARSSAVSLSATLLVSVSWDVAPVSLDALPFSTVAWSDSALVPLLCTVLLCTAAGPCAHQDATGVLRKLTSPSALALGERPQRPSCNSSRPGEDPSEDLFSASSPFVKAGLRPCWRGNGPFGLLALGR